MIKKKKSISVLIIIVALMALSLMSTSTWAVPQLINYQGVLTDKTGNPITNLALPMKFRIYDEVTGGTKLWEEAQTVAVQNGIYNVVLGSMNSVTVDLFSADDRWLEVEVNSEVFTPRQRITSVAFALKAANAGTGGDGVPSGSFILRNTAIPPSGYTYTGNTITWSNSDFWTTKANMPTSRSYSAAVVVNNKIYVIGGLDTVGTSLAVNEEYDPATDTWTTKANMPTARAELASAVVNNKIYVIGGKLQGVVQYKNEEYDPATDTWTKKADMIAAHYDLAAAAVNNKLYAIGGVTSSLGISNINHEYDPTTDTWTTKSIMPTGRKYSVAVVVNNKIYAIGGTDAVGTSLVVNEEYDPATNTWAKRAEMVVARYGLAAAAVNNKIYAIGGLQLNNFLSANEAYTPPVYYYVHQKD